jgi:hypothetical protein
VPAAVSTPKEIRMALALARALAAAAAFASPVAFGAAVLPPLNIDKAQITVSGLSSGGFMANQLGCAYSSTFKGVGVFAGGPYMGAGHSNDTACMYNASLSASMLGTMQADINNWSGTAVDAPRRRPSCLESAASAPATGTTTGTGAVRFTASNCAHTTAGRAHQSGGITLANGSNRSMGLWNVFVSTTLKRTGPNDCVIGTCP